MKDEALSPVGFLMESLPIANPTDFVRDAGDVAADRLIEITELHHEMRKTILDWLRMEHGIEKPSQKLQAAVELDSDAFVEEVRRVRGKRNPLSAAALKNLREEYVRTIEPARALAREEELLERRVSDLVNEAYGLTPDEVALMWQTAPPRMPLHPPA
jgi:hypothetical protein